MATAKRKTAKKPAAKKTAAKKTTAKKATTVNKAPAKRVAKKASATRKKPVVKRTTQTVKQTVDAPKQAAKTVTDSVAMGAAVPTMEEAFAFGNDFFSQMFGNAKTQMPKQAADASRQFTEQGAQQLAKASDAASRSLNDALELSKENAEAVIESGNIAAGASKAVGAELFNYANKAFSQNVEISKELFACRTLNDMFDLQSRILKSNLDGFFGESVKLSELMFEAANNAAEPIQERLQETAERVNKTWSDAA